MEVADRIAVMNQGWIEQAGSPLEVYDAPANDFVMGFLGPVSTIGGELVRPHDLSLRPTPDGTHSLEAMVTRVVLLGFEVRVDLELAGGAAAYAQLTREEAAQLELEAGDIVYIRHAQAAQAPEVVELSAQAPGTAEAQPGLSA